MNINPTTHKHALAFIIVVVLLDAIGFGIILPVTPQLIIDLAGVDLSNASQLGGYLMFAYALSTESWQLYVWLALAALSGFVSPAFQSIMTSQVPANAQGELQGALSSLNSVTSIIGPLLMTKLFSTYTSVDASYYLPGAPFLAAALLTLASLILFVPLVRHFGLTTLGRRAAPALS